jgi:hypothetical protein
MAYGKPAPRSRLWQCLYRDDLLVVFRARLAAGLSTAPEATDADAMLLRRTEVAYANAGLERAMGNSFRYSTSFKAWGADVDGLAGRICAGADRRLRPMRALSVLLRDGCAHKRLFEKFLGHCGFVFSSKRHMLSIFHRAYRVVNSMPDGKWVKLDSDILDEFRAALMHTPFAFCSLRAPLGETLWATDATPTSGGSTVAPLAEGTADFLYSRAGTRGACLRLDMNHPAALRGRMIPVDEGVNNPVAALPWSVSASYSFRHAHHVNLQEARAVKREIRNFDSIEVRSPVRQLFVGDSRVAVAALARAAVRVGLATGIV